MFHSGYEVNGFDRNYPDMLPPAAQFGTTADMAAMFNAARAAGLLVMPYTNPTWWDRQSPTLRHLPAGITEQDVTALNVSGDPIVQSYGPNSGVVMCPFSSFVQDRILTMVANFTSPTAIVSDALFQDQIGARPFVTDYNPLEPAPMSYFDGWVANAKAYAAKLPINTERGNDALLVAETGFHGSVALDKAGGATARWFGSDANWAPWPMATMLARSSALFYQHDLAPQTMTSNKAQLTWNAAMGYMLSYDMSHFPGPPFNATWLRTVSLFQTTVLASYQAYDVTRYEPVAPGVTETAFGPADVLVTANWNADTSHDVGGTRIAAQGMLVQKPGAVAGVVTGTWNGAALAGPDDHFIITAAVHGKDVMVVYHPQGVDTAIAVNVTSMAWPDAATVTLQSCSLSSREAVRATPGTVVAGTVTASWVRVVGGQDIGCVTVSRYDDAASCSLCM